MPELKLAKLPDRTPVKLVLTVSPDLHRALHTYAEIYRETYGAAESVSDLIPYMLKSFLDADRGFAKARRERPRGERLPEPVPAPRRGRRAGRDVAPLSSTEN